VSLQKRISILLVEDDEAARDIICSMLERGYPHARIFSAGDGKTGLDSFRTYLPEIVITDINMPEVNGVRMLEIISAINPAARVIVITAHSDRQTIQQINSTGFDIELVPKPIDFETLFASINRCIVSLP